MYRDVSPPRSKPVARYPRAKASSNRRRTAVRQRSAAWRGSAPMSEGISMLNEESGGRRAPGGDVRSHSIQRRSVPWEWRGLVVAP
jgi:hypothetical protein